MLKIECAGLTLLEGKELEAYLKTQKGVSEVWLELDWSELHTRSVQPNIPNFHLLFEVAGGIASGELVAAAGKAAAAEFGKDIYKALKEWMGRYSDKGVVPVEVKLYGADGKLIDTIRKTR